MNLRACEKCGATTDRPTVCSYCELKATPARHESAAVTKLGDSHTYHVDPWAIGPLLLAMSDGRRVTWQKRV